MCNGPPLGHPMYWYLGQHISHLVSVHFLTCLVLIFGMVFYPNNQDGGMLCPPIGIWNFELYNIWSFFYDFLDVCWLNGKFLEVLVLALLDIVVCKECHTISNGSVWGIPNCIEGGSMWFCPLAWKIQWGRRREREGEAERGFKSYCLILHPLFVGVILVSNETRVVP